MRRIELNLLDEKGETLLELNTIEGVLEQTLGDNKVLLPPLSPGFYFLEYQAFENITDPEPSKAGRIGFFSFTPEQLPVFSSVSSYPSAFIAGGMGMLEARITIPEGYPGDFIPYFRWVQGDVVLGEGPGTPIQDGFQNIITVKAPQSSGIYSAEVQVFPMSPSDEGDFDFASRNSQRVEVVVSSSATLSEGVNNPEDFFFLMPFSGTLDVLGDRTPKPQLRKELLPGLRQQVFGYEFLPDRWIELPEFLLPVDKDGRIINHTLLADIVLDFLPIQDSIEIFSTTQKVSGFRYDLTITPSGALKLMVGDSESITEVSTPGGVIFESQVAQLGMSLFHIDESTYGILLIVDGVIYASTEVTIPPSLTTASEGSSIIGKNFSGIIDELGFLYKKNGTVGTLQGELFARSMERRYKDSLEYAISFESGELDSRLRISDGVRVVPGSLILPPGNWVTLPNSTFSSKAMSFTLSTLPQMDPTLSRLEIRWSQDSGEQIWITFDGGVILHGDEESEFLGYLTQGVDDEGLSLDIFAAEGSLFLLQGGEPIKISLADEPIQALSFNILRIKEAETELSLRSILAVRNGEPIIQDILESLN
jgi:hypothetical protein